MNKRRQDTDKRARTASLLIAAAAKGAREIHDINPRAQQQRKSTAEHDNKPI
jgi:hypothetical protein